MDLKRCDKGHFYDAEKFAFCPHCAEGAEENVSALADRQEFRFERKPDPTEQVHTGLGGIFEKVRTMTKEPRTHAPVTSAGTGRTGTGALETAAPQKNADRYHTSADMTPDDDERTVALELQESETEEHTVALQDAYEAAVADQDDIKTVGFLGEGTMEPVVGWLVITDGADRGKSFSLYAGKNNIGRAAMMDICLLNDAKIRRNKHAVISYDPRSGKFKLLCGESEGMIYRNDEEDALDGSVLLSDRDRLVLGDTTLLFVPLCNETFRWDNV